MRVLKLQLNKSISLAIKTTHLPVKFSFFSPSHPNLVTHTAAPYTGKDFLQGRKVELCQNMKFVFKEQIQ